MAVVVPLVFFLKVTCPLSVGCLSDPFLMAVFSPLLIVKIFGVDSSSWGWYEALAILSFWIIIGALFWHLIGRIKTNRNVRGMLENNKRISVSEANKKP